MIIINNNDFNIDIMNMILIMNNDIECKTKTKRYDVIGIGLGTCARPRGSYWSALSVIFLLCIVIISILNINSISYKYTKAHSLIQ